MEVLTFGEESERRLGERDIIFFLCAPENEILGIRGCMFGECYIK